MFHKPIDEIFPNPPEGLERALLDETRIPKHVAVIIHRALCRDAASLSGLVAVAQCALIAESRRVAQIDAVVVVTIEVDEPSARVVAQRDAID